MLGLSTLKSFAAAAFVAGQTGAAMGADALRVWVEPTPEDGLIVFHSFASAGEPMQLTYKMTITRIGSGGTSTTSQGGHATIEESGATATLSRSGVNIGSQDTYIVDLTAWGSNGETAHIKLTK